jgi:hypothetical protein
MKDEINLPLAIQDYLPVTFFAVGLFFLAKMIAKRNAAAGNLAFAGGILITLGGLFKATWKLIQAVGGADVPFLNNSLFVLLSGGFIALAWAFWKSRTDKTDRILFPPLIIIAFVWTTAAYFGFMTESRAWFFILLGTATLANIALLVQLISSAVQNRFWLVAGLYLINFIGIIALARNSDQTVTMQWLKQIVTTFAQLSFAIASWLFLKNESLRAIKR